MHFRSAFSGHFKVVARQGYTIVTCVSGGEGGRGYNNNSCSSL